MKTTITFILLLITSMFSLTAWSADWPQYGGPDGRWIANAGDHQYLQDWSKAKLVWKNETAEIGPGRIAPLPFRHDSNLLKLHQLRQVPSDSNSHR
jgi:hypothetical protein